ncbi:MAG: DUF1592 domain-containing protein [Lentisphaeraceae bacterium]|nr:DUF1592 domain-containing protein [Lentisphaeraceae bacterium]
MIKLFFLLFTVLCIIAQAQVTPTSLSQARKKGRSNSAFIKNVPNKRQTALALKADLKGFHKTIKPILKKSCLDCHGSKKSKGNFRVDKLNPDLLSGPDINRWVEVYEVLSTSEMPPEDEPDYHLADQQRSVLVDWIGREMNKAHQFRRNKGGHSSFRRMAKYEYNYALQDLLGLPYSFANDLPTESTSEDGFKNSSELLQMSAMQFQTYREIGLKALKKAIILGEKPEEISFMISMREEMQSKIKRDQKWRDKHKNQTYKDPITFGLDDKKRLQQLHYMDKKTGIGTLWASKRYNPAKIKGGALPPLSKSVLVMNKNQTLRLVLGNKIPETGNLRVRIRVGRTSQKSAEYANLRLSISAHTSNNAGFSAVISRNDMPVTATANKPEIIEFIVPLSEIPRNPLRHGKGKDSVINEYLSITNISNAGGNKPTKLHIDFVEISGPYYPQWPPKSHQAIFKTSRPLANNEYKASHAILKRFMIKAWRRSVSSNEVKGFVTLFEKYRPQFETFEEAMIEVLATVLASPEFLYITEKSLRDKSPQKVSQMEMAMRLSIFLWSSIPDMKLLKLAHQKKLTNPKTLMAQTKRMLADPRALRFSENFVNQWLGLEKIDGVNIDRKIHPGYNNELKQLILKEPLAFFNEVLKNNRSVIDFIHSDYVVVNEKMAEHYSIKSVSGPHFRKVKVNADMNRGGLLTSAAVLTMNSDGKDSHPLKRGIWLLEHFLNDPPPPPPPNIPEVDLTDPRILQMTLKERLADHRNKAACISCHAKIDPWGIAFENYDAIGNFRTRIKNKKVDATSELYNKQKLDGMTGLKHYLLSDRQDQFTRALVHKMTAYALGRPLTFSDRAGIDKITKKLRKKGDRLGHLVSLIISSELFHSK